MGQVREGIEEKNNEQIFEECIILWEKYETLKGLKK